jgi:endonuclease G
VPWVVPEHCLIACPEARSDGLRVTRTLYTLSMNAETRFADWVAYTVRPSYLGESCGEESRPRDWAVQLPSSWVMDDPAYANAPRPFRYHRGHMAPLETFACAEDWAQVNFMSNIFPHRGSLNSGAWSRLEAGVRKAVAETRDGGALAGGRIYVITGNLYTGAPVPKLNTPTPHIVPTEIYKLILLRMPGTGSGADLAGDLAIVGFRLPQRYQTGLSGRPYERCLAGTDELSAAAGLSLLPGLGAERIAAAGAKGAGLRAALRAAMGFTSPFEDIPCPVDPDL